MKPLHIALCLSGLLVLTTTVLSYSTGVLPGTVGGLGPISSNVARSVGCGQCHQGPPGSNVVVNVNPSVRTFGVNQTITMDTIISGGVMAPGKETWGGFINEATDGTFTAGQNSKIDATGKFITHKFAFLGRTFNYTYNTPQSAGLVEIYAAGNTVNGNGLAQGDEWGFHGDPSGVLSVPVRLFANATGNVHHGDGCVGSFGNWPVLGSREVPNIGNGNFGYEVHGAPTGAPGVMFVGANPAFAVPLDLIGIPGCTLRVQSAINISLLTSAGGSSQRGDGTAALAFPLPNLASLQGATLQMQVAMLDIFNGRPLPITLTNAIATTIQ